MAGESRLDPKLVNLCERFSSSILFDFPIDRTRFLLALSGIESSFGRNNVKRFEPAYAPGGRYFKAEHLQKAHEKFGDDASCSWGPWQILYIVCQEYGYEGEPKDLEDGEVSGPYVIKHLNRFAWYGADTVEKVLDAYNSGNHRDKNVPEAYIEKFWKHYSEINLERT